MRRERERRVIARGDASLEERNRAFGESTHTEGVWSEYYENVLGIRFSELVGKTVLDIGGAPEGDIARGAIQMGIKFYTLNPNTRPGHKKQTNFYSDSFIWDNLNKEDKDITTVGGLAQEIPLLDNSMDYVISVGSVPGFLPLKEGEYKAAFSSIIRVLKNGGRAVLFPILEDTKEDPVFNEIVEELRGQHQVVLQVVPGYDGPIIDGKETPCYRMTILK